MKTLLGGLQAHLESGATTMCHCWKLTQESGTRFGFTDHDLPLTFESVTYEAETGLTTSAMETRIGLNVDNLDVLGALESTRLSEQALHAGDFDNASIEIWWVNWTDVSQRVLLRKGHLGEVSRGEHAFTAEIRGLAHVLNQPTGRLYQSTCDADLGDDRCGIDLDLFGYKGIGTVSAAIDRRRFEASGLGAYAAAWFARGKVTWTSGDNDGRTMEVKSHGIAGGDAAIELWQPMRAQISIGDSFTITAGCDKYFETCVGRFNNADNFRGFPHMPGNDFVISYPNKDDTNDGASRFGN